MGLSEDHDAEFRSALPSQVGERTWSIARTSFGREEFMLTPSGIRRRFTSRESADSFLNLIYPGPWPWGPEDGLDYREGWRVKENR
jgi:hypothetical protein